MKSKYNVNDTVFLKKYFCREDGGKMIFTDDPIYAIVERVDKGASFGYCYKLKPLCNIYLGGIMYWEDDIAGLVSTAFESEQAMWRMWGDQ